MKIVIQPLSLIAAFCLSLNLSAQAPKPPMDFQLAYFGETITHPGLSCGLRRRLLASAGGTHQLSVSVEATAYVHPMNHVGMLLMGELDYRLRFPVGLFFDQGLGLGYSHSFLTAPTYRLNSSGMFSQVANFGYTAFCFDYSCGLGYEIRQGGKRTLSPFLRTRLWGELPYNDFVGAHAALLAGAEFPLY